MNSSTEFMLENSFSRMNGSVWWVFQTFQVDLGHSCWLFGHGGPGELQAWQKALNLGDENLKEKKMGLESLNLGQKKKKKKG